MTKLVTAFLSPRTPLRQSGAISINNGGPFQYFDSRQSSTSILASASTVISSADVGVGDALSTQDIVVGTVLAFILAFTYSYLNGQSSSTSFVSWGNKKNDEEDDSTNESGDDDRVFDANNWKDISREENYVLYNTRVKSSLQKLKTNKEVVNVNKTENKLVLVALLALFVPIFSVEFFFALSRQFLCEVGNPSDRMELVQKLCSPV